ncbi:MAG: glycogen/starch/alpha-glucan phosphorylase [Parachlamydiaceae bacterium]|nr:glycogen/starch/alpha-glucan phosphorylase [Parachlamydiaceae bacterium]
MDMDVGYQAEMLASKIKHYLVTAMGRLPEEANCEEFYRAFSFALREEIMINWLAVARTYKEEDVRMLYYLSLEYLPGRILSNNISNLAANEIVGIVLQKMNRNIRDVFSMESDPALGNGGLGRLASCFLDSLATHHYPAQAYGLRYQYGIFEQQIWNGLQVEAPDCWLLSENPWEFRRDLRRVIVKYCGTPKATTSIHGDEIMTLNDSEEVYALPFDIPIIGYSKTPKFSVITLRLWSTKESPRNFQLQSYNAGRLDQAAENTLLTDVLYPNDVHETGKRIRLKQEFLLVSASLQDIIRHYLSNHDNFRAFADKVRIQINDTHPALVIPELIRILIKNHDIPWKMAVDITQAVTGYTNHTILSEALEQWEKGLMFYLLPRQYRIIERLNYEFCNTLRAKYPGDEKIIQKTSIFGEDNTVRMANLAIVGSHKVNGVAQLHSDILRNRVFKEFNDIYPDKFINITNGVTQRRWLLLCNPDLAKFITRHIGDGWICDFPQIANLQKFASNPEAQAEFLAIKKKNKLKLIEFINRENKLRNSAGLAIIPSPMIDTNSIFDVQIKRIHEYKRQLLNILHAIVLYKELLENPHGDRVKRTIIFGGKAASGYVTAKEIIHLIYCVARKVNADPSINGLLKIVYIENYNISRAELVIPAADLSEQISLAGMEASGTGNMKFAMNGALTIGTDDGANIEMREAITDKWWPFLFGASSDEIHKFQKNNSYRPKDYYHSNVKLKAAIDSLKDYTFALNEAEHQAFGDLYHKLIEGGFGTEADRYFNMYDFESYYEVQKKVDQLYAQPLLWAEYALNNIAGMGSFSSDNSIRNYSEKIWQISPTPIKQEILDRIRYEYSVLDVCRVYK